MLPSKMTIINRIKIQFLVFPALKLNICGKKQFVFNG